MFSSLDGLMFVLPLCYHPTTILSVDDDAAFLDLLSLRLAKQLCVLTFDKPELALDYTKTKHNFLPFTSRCLIESEDGVKLDIRAIRNEIYNSDRFKEIVITVTDYDMPHISGIELVKTMEFSPEIAQYAHIILTGKISAEFKEKIAAMGKGNDYIGKDDPDYLNKLLQFVEKRLAKIFQWISYVPARILSRNTKENTSIFFDGNFSPIFNAYVKENRICEFYLFDKQGSYIFLDDEANLSWLFIRNELGIENSIKLATHYGAPQNVIDALKGKSVILSLYEEEDFEKREKIDWSKYLLPAKEFESDDHYLNFFPNLIPSDQQKTHPKYYYAFTNELPDNGIEKEKILSYKTFLREQD